jgi:hypothetical protein
MPARRSSQPARTALACLALAVALALSAGPASALAPPEVAVSLGSTAGVNGSPGGGGAAATVAFLWPFERRFAFGGVLWADDHGTDFADLVDPNTGEPLGTVASVHRMGYGAGWRGEAELLRSESRRWRLLWGADFGYQRQERDLRGLVNGAVSGTLVATGPTFLFRTVGGHSFGASVGWKHAFIARDADPDRATDWGVLQFAWRWQQVPKE